MQLIQSQSGPCDIKPNTLFTGVLLDPNTDDVTGGAELEDNMTYLRLSDQGAVESMWKYDLETALWYEISSEALWVDVTVDPTALDNDPGLRFEYNTENKTKWLIDTAGRAELIETPVFAPGSLLAANACAGQAILVPTGNPDDIITVGTGGDHATLAAALAAAQPNSIVRLVSNLTETATAVIDKAGLVLDLAGYTLTNATATTLARITADGGTIKGGTLSHTKATNTSIETVVDVNVPGGTGYVVDNIINVQEFGVVVRGGAMVEGNQFNYVGASLTNSHRFIALYSVTSETRVHDNTFTCSPKQGTTRYSNFVFMGTTAGSTWTAPLYVTDNMQLGGDLRQFVFDESLVPTAGAELVVTGNSFNDFNGGIGLISTAIYNGLDKIVIADNAQGGDAAGNFKGVFFVDGSGALNSLDKLTYDGNTTAAGPLRADYYSLATNTDNIITAKVGITTPADQELGGADLYKALEETGDLLQELKAKQTYIVTSEGESLQGTGTEDDPFVVPAGGGGTTPTDPPEFAKNVYVNTPNPNTATIFDLANPPVTNDNSLKQDSQNIYFGNDGSVWTWNGTAYTTYVFPATVPVGFNAMLPANFTVVNNVVTKFTGYITLNNTAGAAWNPTTGEFTAPRAGWYNVTATMRFGSGTWAVMNPSYFAVKNTTATEDVWWAPFTGTQNTPTQTVTANVYLSAGQKIWLADWQLSGSNKTIPLYGNTFTVVEMR